MTKITKALVGTAAATAMAVSATPAAARHDGDGIKAGEVIAGALIIGGIAAVLASKNKRDDRYYHGDNRHYGYDNGRRYGYNNYRGVGPRKAVKRCIRRAENRASQYGRAKVTDIRDVKRTRYGYKVKGRISVNEGYRGRGYRHGYAHRDTGKFTCYFERGRVADVRYKGLNNYRY